MAEVESKGTKLRAGKQQKVTHKEIRGFERR